MTKGHMIKKKSKRLTCHKKYKIARKVREHNRKERKEAKKAGNSKFKQAKKDPGVPNCPFKVKNMGCGFGCGLEWSL